MHPDRFGSTIGVQNEDSLVRLIANRITDDRSRFIGIYYFFFSGGRVGVGGVLANVVVARCHGLDDRVRIHVREESTTPLNV